MELNDSERRPTDRRLTLAALHDIELDKKVSAEAGVLGWCSKMGLFWQNNLLFSILAFILVVQY
jgi:hypothetical protein